MRLDHLLSKEEEVRALYTVESWIKRFKGIPVAMRFGETPVLIPNTKVKTETADGTMLETAWESRWLPESLKKIKQNAFVYKILSEKMFIYAGIYQ